MFVNSSQEQGGDWGVWLRVRILNSLVFSLRTTVYLRARIVGKKGAFEIT